MSTVRMTGRCTGCRIRYLLVSSPQKGLVIYDHKHPVRTCGGALKRPIEGSEKVLEADAKIRCHTCNQDVALVCDAATGLVKLEKHPAYLQSADCSSGGWPPKQR